MDPTIELKKIRSNIDAYFSGSHWPLDVVVEELANSVSALDEWISKGASLPAQWSPTKGRPRLADGVQVDSYFTEGEKLRYVVHGTRNGYNHGCRCGGCRKANRDAANQRREKVVV